MRANHIGVMRIREEVLANIYRIHIPLVTVLNVTDNTSFDSQNIPVRLCL